jgi:hypothetical protein
MKNTFLKTIGGAALAILILAMFAQIWVSAQDNSNGEQSNKQTLEEPFEQSEEGTELEGVWNSQVTFINCGTGAAIRTFPAMNTFIRGGTMQEFGIGSGLLRGPGHGVWSYQSEQRYSNVFQFFRFNADGTYAGKVIARRQIAWNGDTYTAKSFIEFLDVNNNLTGRGCATETAERFR